MLEGSLFQNPGQNLLPTKQDHSMSFITTRNSLINRSTYWRLDFIGNWTENSVSVIFDEFTFGRRLDEVSISVFHPDL